MNDAILWVVAGALSDGEGRILMHKRPEGKAHAGLWEFPGGKIEAAEAPVNALIRELSEELGIVINAADCEPVGFAEDVFAADQRSIVILLYRIANWSGEPRALEGGSVAWFDSAGIAALDKPPLDKVLAGQLQGRELRVTRWIDE